MAIVRSAVLVLSLGLSARVLAQAPAGATGTVAGRVVARADSTASVVRPAVGTPVFGATVVLVGSVGRTATSDSAGGFVISDVPAGPVTLRIRRLGYRTLDRRVVVPPNDTVRVEITVESEAQQLSPVHTLATQTEVESFTAKPNVATIVMPARLLAGVPSVGEPDVIRIVQLLPGVMARNDFNTGLNVRGGSSDQNLVLLDGIPIYNPFHMGGLFSTFMDATVGGIELMTGAFPARYDGRLSSVLDVRSADETRPGVHASADLSVLATTAQIGGGLANGRGSWSLAGRRTYADALAKTFSTDQFPYHFSDFHGHADYLLPHDWRFGVTGYTGNDALDLNLATAIGDSTVSTAREGTWQYGWGNTVLGASLGRDFTAPSALGWLLGGTTTFEQRVSTSRFGATLDVAQGAQVQRSNVRDVRATGSLTAHGATNDRSFGWEVSATHVRYGTDSPQMGTTDFDIIQDPVSYAAWVGDLWRPTSRWLVEGGLRGERLTGGEGARDWAALSPRLSLKYFVTPEVALSAAAGRVTQTMHSMAGDGPLRFFEVWLSSDQYIPVETAWHYVLGVERRVESSSIRIEGYVKNYDRVLDANLSDDPTIRGDEFIVGTGRAYGVDVLVRWTPRSGPTGWLSYSYGVAMHEQDGVRWAPGNDRRHDLNLVATWQLARYRLGARFGYATGTPYTPIVGQILRRLYDPSTGQWDAGITTLNLEPLGGARNSARFPATQRLDLDVSREMRLRGSTISPYLSVVNAYNAHNVFVYVYDYSTDRPTRHAYTQFPILPSLGVRVAF